VITSPRRVLKSYGAQSPALRGLRFLLSLCLLAGALAAQQTEDNSGFAKTIPWRIRTSEPGSCSYGEIYLNSVSGAFRTCLAVNIWSNLGGGLTAATFAAPPSSPAVNASYLFSDASAAGACTGGGASYSICVWTGTAWGPSSSSSGASGTVTTFTSGSLAPLFTTSVGTPSVTPAQTFALASTTQNYVLAGPTSGSGAWAARLLVAADIPSLSYQAPLTAFSTISALTGYPAFGTASLINTGTSGGTLCLLNANCTFGGTNAYGTPASINLTNGTMLPITLTTTGSSGAATWTQSTNTLNVPQYAGGGSMTWPSAAGFALYGGSSAWGTSFVPASTAVPFGTGSTFSQDATNFAYTTSTHALAIAGPMSASSYTTPSTGVANYFQCSQGTAPTLSGSNYIAMVCPTSVTSYSWQPPGAAGTGFVFGTNSGGVVTQSFVASIAHASIAATAVTPGSYTAANITVAADGSITAASNGSGGSGNMNTTGTPAAHQVGIFASSSTMAGLAPSATSGEALCSQGASADPAYCAINLAGGSSIITGTLPAANVAAALSGTTSVNGTSIPSSVTLTQTIASGTTAASGAGSLNNLGSIASAACATLTISASGVAATDVIELTPNASLKAVVGFTPATTGGIALTGYPTSGNINLDACNWSTAGLTIGTGAQLNWRVVR